MLLRCIPLDYNFHLFFDRLPLAVAKFRSMSFASPQTGKPYILSTCISMPILIDLRPYSGNLNSWDGCCQFAGLHVCTEVKVHQGIIPGKDIFYIKI